MKKRRALQLEPLEARETPDVSLGHGAAYAIPPASALAKSESATLTQPDTESAAAVLARAHAAVRSLSPQALERFFHSPAALEHLLNGYSASESTAAAADVQNAGWQFIRNYARKAVRNEEARFGPLQDHEDMVQQIFVEWREQVGSRDQAFTEVLQKDTPSRQVLQQTVRRVLDRVRYQQRRAQKTVEFIDQPAPVQAHAQQWADLQIDLAQGVGGLDAQERRTIELRGQGMTFEEIGSEMGILKQRVFEIYHAALGRLQEIYAS
jgi:RNA polymerase sigma factor (sigma-70 family)